MPQENDLKVYIFGDVSERDVTSFIFARSLEDAVEVFHELEWRNARVETKPYPDGVPTKLYNLRGTLVASVDVYGNSNSHLTYTVYVATISDGTMMQLYRYYPG